MSNNIGSRASLFGAILERAWAILAPPANRAPPFQTRGGGGGGGVHLPRRGGSGPAWRMSHTTSAQKAGGITACSLPWPPPIFPFLYELELARASRAARSSRARAPLDDVFGYMALRGAPRERRVRVGGRVLCTFARLERRASVACARLGASAPRARALLKARTPAFPRARGEVAPATPVVQPRPERVASQRYRGSLLGGGFPDDPARAFSCGAFRAS